MQEAILSQYRELMGKLESLPQEIAAAQTDLAQAKMTRSQTNKTLADLEVQIIQHNGGWANLGKNDGDRKNALADILAKHATYQGWVRTLGREEAKVSELEIEVDTFTREYGAVCYQARLLAGLMSYLGNAGAPVQAEGDIDFSRSLPHNGTASNGSVTAADAAAIGL
jgi:hypothetical protein